MDILFIGVGNMGGALVDGLCFGDYADPRRDQKDQPNRIACVDKSERILERYPNLGVFCFGNIRDALAQFKADVILLAVKPHQLQAVSDECRGLLGKDCLVLSMLAGVSLGALSASFATENCGRMMPNMLVSKGFGLLSLYLPHNVIDRDFYVDQLTNFFSPSSRVFLASSDREIDLFTAAVGSGPAFFYNFYLSYFNAMRFHGIGDKQAGIMMRHLISGANEVARGLDDFELQEMIDQVMSSKGTTQAGLEVMRGNDNEFYKIIEETIAKALSRAQEIGNS